MNNLSIFILSVASVPFHLLSPHYLYPLYSTLYILPYIFWICLPRLSYCTLYLFICLPSLSFYFLHLTPAFLSLSSFLLLFLFPPPFIFNLFDLSLESPWLRSLILHVSSPLFYLLLLVSSHLSPTSLSSFCSIAHFRSHIHHTSWFAITEILNCVEKFLWNSFIIKSFVLMEPLKRQSNEIFDLQFFLHSNLPGLLIKWLKYSRFWLIFRWVMFWRMFYSPVYQPSGRQIFESVDHGSRWVQYMKKIGGW